VAATDDRTALLTDRDLALNEVDELPWRPGANARMEVARRLTALVPEWLTLHKLPGGEGASDIDHLVVGPGGVFTVNTQHRRDSRVVVIDGQVQIDGQWTSFVRDSRREAGRAARLLSARTSKAVEVRGIVAVMGTYGGFTVHEQPRDGAVTVVTRRNLCTHLQSLPTVLDRAEIGRIHEIARHLATWRPETVSWSEDLLRASGRTA
jgi:hypothetical protein